MTRQVNSSMRGGSRRLMAVLAAAGLIVAACSGDDGTATITTVEATTTAAETAPPDTTAPVETTTTTEAPPAELSADDLAAIEAALSSAPAGCDPLVSRQCLLPFPSNAYTVADASSGTGLRVAFPADGTPTNADGVSIDPAEWNRNDGFSPTGAILTYLDGLDFAASDLPTWTDLGASRDDDATVVIVDADTGERIPLFAEPDAKAAAADDTMLMIYPAIPLLESGHYVVGLRGLVGTDGNELEPTALFRSYRDGVVTDIDQVEARRPAMDLALDALERSGIDRSDLQLAWDFRVASAENIAGRVLHARDETLALLGDTAPAFTAEVSPEPPDGIAIMVEGTYTVTNWLTGDGSAGNRFNYGEGVTPTGDEMPVANGTVEAAYRCAISDATVEGTEPARIAQYGHGLLGSNREVTAGNVRAFSNEHNVVFCATKWAGMSEDDISNAIDSLMEISNFPSMADRMQQGMINQIVLGRLMTQPDGLVSHPAFQRADGTPLIDTSTFAYDGNSQGGIMGMTLAALSPDFERAVLGVVGMNYSMLLPRSVDFDQYELVFIPAYPNDLDRTLILSMIQMLWDRGEGAGYVQHITSDPYPGTPTKDILLHVAFGDWQVTEISAFIAARAMGAAVHRPVAADGRSGEVDPGWNLPSIMYPHSGSALIIWDSGSDPIPFEGLAPRTSRDSHEDPRANAEVRRQKAAFMFDGTLIDVCGEGLPCTVPPRD